MNPELASEKRGVLRFAPVVARGILGLVFLGSGVFGLLIALGVVPMPVPATPPSEGAAAFFTGIQKSGYFMVLLKTTEIVCGALLLANRFVPLALTGLAAVVVNIFFFHAFLAPSGVGLAALLVALESYLGYAYREAFRGVLAARAIAK